MMQYNVPVDPLNYAVWYHYVAGTNADLNKAIDTLIRDQKPFDSNISLTHKIKRLDRLAGNRHLKTERMALYGTMAQFLLKSLPLPLVIVDWSPLTDDQSQRTASSRFAPRERAYHHLI